MTEAGEASLEYERLLGQGETLLNQRRHSAALLKFERASKLLPEAPEAASHKIQALFYMDRFEEAVNLCTDSLQKSPSYPELLKWCWASRLEAEGSPADAKSQVAKEIEELLGRPGPSPEQLFAAYQGYYFLKDREKRVSTILILAGLQVESDLGEDVSAALFEEILEAKTAANRIRLAESYIRNFPDGRMADHAAGIFLKEIEKTQAVVDPGRTARSALSGNTASRRLNAGVAYWLIEKQTEPELAIDLLKQSLSILENRGQLDKPKYFTDDLWQEELDKDRDIYLYLTGRAWFIKGDMDSASNILLDVLKRHDDWPGVHRFLGRIALEQNRQEDAIKHLRRAVSIGDLHEETEKLLSELLMRLYGYKGEARRYFLKQEKTVAFQDVSDSAGLSGVQSARVAWGDYNRDGFEDLLVDGNRLFRNQAGETFVEVTTEAGLASLKGANGGVFGDYDNDGLQDIFITSHSQNRLFRNIGGNFTDVTKTAMQMQRSQRTEASAWGDVDGDGYLDLYTANYERPGVMRGLCVHDRLFRNDRKGGFVEVSRDTGIIGDEAMCGRGVIWSDLNDDGRQDILVSNYRLDPNFLWLNTIEGGLADRAEESGVRGHNVVGDYGHTIASAAGDLDGDGDIDLVISNLSHPRYMEFSDKSMVLLNTGGPSFEFIDRFMESGIAFEESSADAAMADVDNDGDLDVYFTSIYPGRFSHLYLNDGHARFMDVTWLSGTRVENSWGAAFADFDNDGFPDLAVAGRSGLRLFRNEGNANRWLKVKIEDERCNRYGVGAKVTANYSGGRQVREIYAGRGTGSQDALPVILGLGGYKGDVDVELRTACGDVLSRKFSESDSTVTIRNSP